MIILKQSFGYTAEFQGDYIKLVYLRARHYAPSMGRFLSRDTWDGITKRPLSFNKWMYTEGNPINMTDHAGLSPDVDCSLWDWYFKGLCTIADGSDTDKSTLDAREKLFYAMTVGGYAKYWLGGGAYGSQEGYAWASNLLFHFLEGSGSKVYIRLASNDPFVNDPGITRATKRFATQATDDEADVIGPLLYDFISNYVKAKVSTDGVFKIGPIELLGKQHYYNRPGKKTGLEPRAHDHGYWAAFGHVTIDGDFSAIGYYRCAEDQYFLSYVAEYSIKDYYGWYENKSTPFPFGPGGTTVWIPHEWELSLVNAGRAKMFDFDVSWRESGRLLVSPGFTSWSQAPWLLR